MKNSILLGISLFLLIKGYSQKYQFTVDLVQSKNRTLKVDLKCPSVSSQEITYNFPASIPGAYMWLNYGKLIDEMLAFDGNGKPLKVKRISENSFKVFNANRLSTLSYTAKASFGSKAERAIRRCIGTNFEEGKNYLLNAPGLFGYFEGLEKLPIELEIIKPNQLDGHTSLKTISKNSGNQKFYAQNYHQLVDCPIIFTLPDTSSFKAGNCNIKVVVYAESGAKYSELLSSKFKPNLIAAEKFFGTLPVNNYTFIIYLTDMADLVKQYNEGKLGMLKLIKIKKSGVTKEGALEHGNSSVYSYIDAGDTSFVNDITNAAVHEFMHIIVPLNLHSNRIGEFNYTNPRMSKHLWLYEGVTEYINHLSLLQASNLNTVKYLQIIRDKIINGSQFPSSEMSFTEMSENVLEEKFHKQYSQVYQRGAVLGLLLDAEIIKLTNGNKNLKDVLLKLMSKYGQNKSFDDEMFIKEFVGEVHPDLKLFFDKYICGKEPWDLTNGLKIIGIDYCAEKIINRPRHIQYSNDIKVKSIDNGKFKVTKTGMKEWAGLRKGDIYNFDVYPKTFKIDVDKYVPEGSIVNMLIIRNGKTITIPIKVVYMEQMTKNIINEIKDKTEEQQRFFNKWIGA